LTAAAGHGGGEEVLSAMEQLGHTHGDSVSRCADGGRGSRVVREGGEESVPSYIVDYSEKDRKKKDTMRDRTLVACRGCRGRLECWTRA